MNRAAWCFTATVVVACVFLAGCKPKSVTVPSVVGMAQAAAEAGIISAGLAMGTVTQQLSGTVPVGNVISQNPAADTKVSRESAVNLVVSAGPTLVPVPNVVGIAQTAAQSALTSNGFALGTVAEEYNDTVPAGNVVTQNPTAGTNVIMGSSVNLVVSKGPQPVTVPNVIGQTQSVASSALVSAGLAVGEITQAYNAAVPSGSVISQNPTSGSSVFSGSPVALMVSQGPQLVTVPNLVGMTQAEATTSITGAGLTLGIVTQDYSATVASGIVITHSPTAGGSVVVGTTVALTISKGPQPVVVPSVVGLTHSTAATTITTAGLALGVVIEEYSATVPSGLVIAQLPAAGGSVPFGSAIALTISKGPQTVSVPDVVGMTQAVAQTTIVDADLIAGTVTRQCSNTVSTGLVISQTPLAGHQAPSGSAVALTVSTGLCPATVPDVVGLPQSAASTAIIGAGLTMGTLTQQCSNTISAGSVISQTPLASQQVLSGSTVALTVSTGFCPVTAPDIVGMTQEAASTAIIGAGLTVGTVTQRCSNTVPTGSVISQSPLAGQQVQYGSSLELSVSTGTCLVSYEMVQVPAGTFTMGNSGVGDDATDNISDELPQHQVTLSAYEIGKFEVTNKQYCDLLNWALAQGFLKDSTGDGWAGAGEIYAGSNLQQIAQLGEVVSNIRYLNGTFSPVTRVGLPDQTDYPMDTHPMIGVTWYGAVAFCNWLSQTEGLTLCYDMTTVNWPLTVAPPTPGGYRLPTEAEWERAGAWDGYKHWIYGFSSNTNERVDQCNGFRGAYVDDAYVNPLGLSLGVYGASTPCTSPVGWFNGVNVSPHFDVTTVNSVSPSGCYDMSGNASEWCGDWYGSYGSATQMNPTGSASSSYRVIRGGSWRSSLWDRCRSAHRGSSDPALASNETGFRIAMSVAAD